MKNTTSLSRRNLAAALSAFPALVALGAPVLAEGSFTDLVGSLGGTSSSPASLSADGAVVVGRFSNGGSGAFRWEGGATEDLGTLGGTYSTAVAASADGAVVVGTSGQENDYQRAFRWEDGNMTGLGTIGTSSSATGVSANGAVVVGNDFISSTQRAFRWEAGNIDYLATLGGARSSASAVSADGAVVVGSSEYNDGGSGQAVRWEDGEILALETSERGSSAVSANGTVVVGNSRLENDEQRAFRWEGNVITDLGTLDGDTTSIARAMSADGRVVVGYSEYEINDGDDSVRQAFRWSTTGGLQSVDDWVTAAGGEVPEGYVLTEATGVNDDGSIVTGRASYNGNKVAWLATGTTYPETGGGFLGDTAAFDRSVIQAGGSAASVGISTTNLALGGSHHRTLLDSGLVMSENGTCAWSTVDAARNDTTKATTTLGEIGICGDVAGYRIGAGVGTTKTNQDWDLGGSARYTGDYLLAEVDREFATAGGSTLQASLLSIMRPSTQL